MPADGPGNGSGAGPGPASFLMNGDMVSVRDGLRRALSVPPLCDQGEGFRGTAEIVLAEVLNNIVEHAYAGTAGPIRLTLQHQAGLLTCLVEDEGAAMPGGVLPAGGLPSPLELAEGGFGWHLIRALTTDLTYQRLGRTNRLSFMLLEEQSAP